MNEEIEKVARDFIYQGEKVKHLGKEYMAAIDNLSDINSQLYKLCKKQGLSVPLVIEEVKSKMLTDEN